MTLPHFIAFQKGYDLSRYDLECLMVKAGYWAAYYNNAKNAKPVSSVLEQMHDQYYKPKKSKGPKPEVNVDLYLQREESFNRRREKLRR